MKNRSRQWNIDENNFNEEEFKNALDKIKKIKGVFYAYCIHDQEETIHYHLVCTFINAISFDSIKNKFPRAHIETTIDLQASLQYLTHKNDIDKTQYDVFKVVTNNNDKFLSYYNETFSTCYIDDDAELYKDLKLGLNMSDIITSEKYSLRYLNQRKQIIETAINIYYRERIRENSLARCINNLYANDIIPFNADSPIFETLKENSEINIDYEKEDELYYNSSKRNIK